MWELSLLSLLTFVSNNRLAEKASRKRQKCPLTHTGDGSGFWLKKEERRRNSWASSAWISSSLDLL